MTKDDGKIDAVVCVIEHVGRILLLKRSVRSFLKGWCLPGGMLEEGEGVVQGILREVREETGISLERSELEYVGEEESIKNKVVSIFRVMLSEKPEVVLSEEHTQYMWSMGDLLDSEYAGNTLSFIRKALIGE